MGYCFIFPALRGPHVRVLGSGEPVKAKRGGAAVQMWAPAPQTPPRPHFLPNKPPALVQSFDRGSPPRGANPRCDFSQLIRKSCAILRISDPNDHLNPISREGRARGGGMRDHPPATSLPLPLRASLVLSLCLAGPGYIVSSKNQLRIGVCASTVDSE